MANKDTTAAAAATAADETESNIKVPKDLTKVSHAKAKELVEAGLVDDRDLPGKWYARKQDGFKAKIPDYTFEAYGPDLKGEWEEIKLTSDPEPEPEPGATS